MFKEVILFVILSIMLSASTGCFSEGTYKAKEPIPQTIPQSTPPLILPPPLNGYLPADIEIYADNRIPVMDKWSSAMLNLTIIANHVAGGTVFSFDYEIYAIYPNGSSKINPPEINLNFKPLRMVFPKTVNRTEPPYKLYSRLTITSASDADYFITIKIDNKKLYTYAQPIYLKVGKGGYVPRRYPPVIATSKGNVTRSISPSIVKPGSSLNITLTPMPATLFSTPGYQVIETIPYGFTFVGASIAYVYQDNAYNFTQTGSTPVTYTLIASSIEGNYTIFGIFKDASANTGTVSGDARIRVGSS